MCHVAGDKMLAGLEPLSGGGIDTNCGKACAIASNSRRYGDGENGTYNPANGMGIVLRVCRPQKCATGVRQQSIHVRCKS